MTGYKILTEDNFSPIQKSSSLILPIGFTLPYKLPKVELDISVEECGKGWNFSKTVKEAFDICKVVGFYGIHNIYKVEGSDDSIIRGNKIRCSELTILDKISSEELFEPNNKVQELFEWLYLKQEPESEEIIREELFKTLEIKKLKFKIEFFKLNYYYNYYDNYNNYDSYNNNNNYSNYNNYYNNYYHNYYYNYYNYNNNYNNYHNYYYNYNYAFESLLEPNINFRKSLIRAYKHGMRQIRFNEKENTIIVCTKANLPVF